MSTVVSDSGPLTHLWQAGQWRAFSTFTAVHIAEQVAQEVSLHVSLNESEQFIGYAISVHDVLRQRSSPVVQNFHPVSCSRTPI